MESYITDPTALYFEAEVGDSLHLIDTYETVDGTIAIVRRNSDKPRTIFYDEYELATRSKVHDGRTA